VRLLPNGFPDLSFGNQGFLAPGYRILFPAENLSATRLTDVARTPGGNLLFVGDIDHAGDGVDTDGIVAQLKEQDGELDTGFGALFTGRVAFLFNEGGDSNDHATAVQVLSDGAIVVTGSVQTADQQHVPFLVKMDAVGAPFPGFGTNGQKFFITCAIEPCDMTPRDLQLSDSGDFLLAGTSSGIGDDDFFVFRLTADGERDSDFGLGNDNDDGVAYVDIAGTNDNAYRVLPQGERVLVAGDSDIDGFGFTIARLDHGIEETFTVSPDPGIGGSMSPATDQIVNHSDQVDFVATADPGFALVQVTGCGVTEFQGVYTTAPVTADCTVTAEFSPDLVVTYTAGPNGSIVGESPQIAVFGGNAKEVEAVGDTGYHFAQWDDGVLDNPRQDTNITQNIDVTALFDINLYEVVPNPGPGGALSPSEAVMVQHGGNAQFIVQPDPGFAIGERSGCAGTLQGNVFTTDAIFEGCKVNVTFVVSNEMFSLQYLTDGHGTITGDAQQSVLSGADGTPVTAVPDPGYQFAMWKDGSISNPRQDTHVVADIEVTAIFVSEQFFTVTPTASQGGSISPNLLQVVAGGENVAFTLTPNVGFVIQGVGGTCGGTLVGNTYTTLGVTANCTVIANFVTEQEAADAIFSDGFED
jgi:hypothetical protein